MTNTRELLGKIESNDAVVGIVGLGYVGLPLMMEFADEGFPVVGFDVDPKKISQLDAGETYIKHLPSERIKELISDNPKASSTADFSRISDVDAILIAVPTPLSDHRDPDLSYVVKTAETIAPFLRKGQLVALESTTYPGTTEEVLAPVLEDGSGLKAGEDFYVAYSPEREDPNNAKYNTKTIPKVVGADDDDSRAIANALYGKVICETVPVSSCRAAEATKLTENIFRCINIALVNELKVIYKDMDIDVWEVIHAASTKPFGFMPFYPGPGLGGHCIPIDPFYLTWKAREFGQNTRFIELAGEINTAMPEYVINQTMLAMNEQGKALQGSRILLVGLAYKKNVDDDRESPTYVLWDQLVDLGAKVGYYDPYCPVVRPSREHSHFAGIPSAMLEDVTADNFDVAIISTAHDGVDHDALAAQLPLVVDTRNACSPAENVVKA
jgi:UDP-N-acetyl-D-glucosamine dehydrogenase